MSAWNEAVEMFRVRRDDGQIEFIDNHLYEGPVSKLPLHVVALFGITSGGKSTACRFLSCSMGVPTDFPSSTIGPQHEPTRGLWGSPVVDADGNRFIILDIEGFDNSEQDQKVAEAVLKLLALLSEVTSVFIQVRRTPTIQASDLEYIATFVSQVRSTLLQRPVAAKGDAGPADNFPALLIAHVMPLHLKRGEQEEKALEITKQALASQPEVIQTISENYVELSRKEGQGLHFDYLTLYELPMFKRFQQLMDTAKTPADLQEQVRNLVDMNEEPSSPLYKAGAAFLDDVDFLRDKIHNVSQVRTDGRGHAITPESFRQLLKWGVQEMNKVGPLNNVYLWEKIAIDACTKQLQDKIDELGAKVKEVAASQSGGLVEAISAATEELEDLFNGLNLQTNGKARESCDKMKASTWALVIGPFKDQVLLEANKRLEDAKKREDDAKKRAEDAKKLADDANKRADDAIKQVDEARREVQDVKRHSEWQRWQDYLQQNLPWVALILLSLAIIIHRFSAAVADCCSCFKGAPSLRPLPEVELTRIRQLEQDLVHMQSQRRDWPPDAGALSR
ncbi:unnamed protein product [Symbiodinium pilosum]|uniref:Uncharacterized protein n=1 Tax=Symbiodinium pilosum TaxID=2952 RepID=A0A812SXW6_SYMPI|nr:unnamed protein product [Symbiodinium pilosum]